MSAVWIIEYAGAPVALDDAGVAALVPERQASRFTDESSGWYAAHKAGLASSHVKVVNLYVRNQQTGARE